MKTIYEATTKYGSKVLFPSTVFNSLRSDLVSKDINTAVRLLGERLATFMYVNDYVDLIEIKYTFGRQVRTWVIRAA